MPRIYEPVRRSYRRSAGIRRIEGPARRGRDRFSQSIDQRRRNRQRTGTPQRVLEQHCHLLGQLDNWSFKVRVFFTLNIIRTAG
jgi:hypothetical protein